MFVCLFVGSPPIRDCTLPGASFIIILIGFWNFHFICLEAKAIKLEAHKESVTVFSCHDVLIFYIRYILNLSHLEFLPINPNFTLLK